MRLLFITLSLILLISVLAACDPAAVGGLLTPEMSITPATQSETSADVASAAAQAEIEAKRTPIQIKVPPPPTATPTSDLPSPTPTNQATPTPDEEPTVIAEAVPADTATPEPPVEAPEPTPVSDNEGGEATDPILPISPENQVDEALLPTPVSRPQGLDNTLNILVIGSDERSEGHPYRSDVMMIVAVDFATREVGVISFPRDMWVRIPTVGQNRLNTATFFGELYKYEDGRGVGLLRDTLGQTFGIRIDHYVKFDFESFKDIVDALGGIDVEVDCAITGRFPIEEGSSQAGWRTLEAGEYHMDGFFALLYARQRKTTSDIDRTRRQQRILIAMRNRAREINLIPRIPALYDALKESIETDLGLTDIIALGRLGVQIDTEDAHGYTIGYKELKSWRTPAGAAVLLPDVNAINERLNDLFEQPSILKNQPRRCN